MTDCASLVAIGTNRLASSGVREAMTSGSCSLRSWNDATSDRSVIVCSRWLLMSRLTNDFASVVLGSESTNRSRSETTSPSVASAMTRAISRSIPRSKRYCASTASSLGERSAFVFSANARRRCSSNSRGTAFRTVGGPCAVAPGAFVTSDGAGAGAAGAAPVSVDSVTSGDGCSGTS